MGRTLDILVVAPTPYFADRGCHVRIHLQVSALRRRGHRVTVLTYHGGDAGEEGEGRGGGEEDEALHGPKGGLPAQEALFLCGD